MMKRKLIWSLGAFVLFGLAFVGLRSALGDEHDKVILRFDTMIGDPGPSSSLNTERGFTGAGVPWTILRSARGELRSDGSLKIHVSGLVIPPPTLNNSNPSPEFRGALSCQNPDNPNDSLLFFTDPFPATPGVDAGNSDIDGHVQLPDSCFAPLIFVTSSTPIANPNGVDAAGFKGAVWFAVTGFSPASLTHNDDNDNQ
jgi:hypothetical protein